MAGRTCPAAGVSTLRGGGSTFGSPVHRMPQRSFRSAEPSDASTGSGNDRLRSRGGSAGARSGPWSEVLRTQDGRCRTCGDRFGDCRDRNLFDRCDPRACSPSSNPRAGARLQPEPTPGERMVREMECPHRQALVGAQPLHRDPDPARIRRPSTEPGRCVLHRPGVQAWGAGRDRGRRADHGSHAIGLRSRPSRRRSPFRERCLRCLGRRRLATNFATSRMLEG